ncbi:hypothetical protein DY000_02039904 [Brassica cretica]|uniref:EF-hand domain-containing protein n=1 Tax=Brassica cretica TaxID=69181 RepID=A0ABQ7BAS4_BRACR|nr:hypothetical protein DY000_02039904 [Brassica cretica]
MSSRRKASTKSRHDRSVPDSCSSQHNDVAPKVEFAVHSVDPEEADAYWAARGKVKPPRPSDAPRIVDPGQDDVIMAETDVSSTKDKAGWINGEHTDLKPTEVRVYELDELSELSDTTLELDEVSDTTLDLDELSDTNLELSELSDTEDGAGLAAGRNGHCSAQRKVHKKFNMEHFLFLGVVSSKQTSLFRWTCASYQATDRNPSFVGLVKMFEADQRGLFSQFEVREFCNNLVEGVVKALKDVSKIQKKSTTTRAPVAEPSLIISEKPKGKSENNLEDLKDFSDSLPIFDEYDEELIENLMICEDNCKLPFQNLILCLMMKKLMD